VVDEEMAYDYLQYDLTDHTARTMIAGVQQLPPSHWLVLDGRGRLTVQRYYTLPYRCADVRCDDATVQRLGKTYRALLTEAVRLRLRTDVPLGSCLSGGLDSSAIVCAMHELLAVADNRVAPQRTFTAAYDDPTCDERRFADAVSAATAAEAHYVFPRAEELWDEITKVTWHQDEPFGSTSIYAQWCVMRAARQAGVTVMLDGQGGDELFAGYVIYYSTWLKELLRRGRFGRFWQECRAAAPLLERTPFRLAAKAASVWYEPLRALRSARVRGLHLLNGEFAARQRQRHAMWQGWQRTADLQARLHGDEVQFRLPRLLRYEDRNSMAFSIEARAPFIDVRLVEWAFQQPPSVKLRQGWTKYVARQGIAGLCPDAIVWRTDKVGFATPEARWMHAGTDVLRALSEPSTFRAGRYIDPVKLQAEAFPGGRPTPRWRHELWRAANFELWMRVFGVAA
jgi:asparagine synthase (glutamine-hydrolysing)